MTYENALCADSDPDLWTDARIDSRERRILTAYAATVCGQCPVRTACHDDAERRRTAPAPFERDRAFWRPVGIWAGQLYDGTRQPPAPVPTTPEQVRAISRRKPQQPCGTRAAYIRHTYRGETPCDECVSADKTYHAIRHTRVAV